MSEICGNFEVPVGCYLDEAVTNHKSGVNLGMIV